MWECLSTDEGLESCEFLLPLLFRRSLLFPSLSPLLPNASLNFLLLSLSQAAAALSNPPSSLLSSSHPPPAPPSLSSSVATAQPSPSSTRFDAQRENAWSRLVRQVGRSPREGTVARMPTGLNASGCSRSRVSFSSFFLFFLIRFLQLQRNPDAQYDFYFLFGCTFLSSPLPQNTVISFNSFSPSIFFLHLLVASWTLSSLFGLPDLFAYLKPHLPFNTTP